MVDDTEPELLDLLAHERDQMTRRIGCVTRNRDAISGHLDAVRTATADREAVAGASR